MPGKLVLLAGPTACGKTTLARAIAKVSNGIHLCLEEVLENLGIDLFDEDDLRVTMARQWQRCEHLLLQDLTVVLDWNMCFWQQNRDELRQRATKLGVHVELFYFQVTSSVLKERIFSKSTALPQAIILEMVLSMMLSYKVPSSEEKAMFRNVYCVCVW